MKTLLAILTVCLLAVPSLAAKGKASKASKPSKPVVTTPVKPEGTTADPRATDGRGAPPPSDPANVDGPVDTGTRKGPARIEFDDRLVQGQTNKANAIYLFERRESALRSLLKKRTDFHDEIDEMLEDELVK